jgi:hypothetical protein
MSTLKPADGIVKGVAGLWDGGQRSMENRQVPEIKRALPEDGEERCSLFLSHFIL